MKTFKLAALALVLLLVLAACGGGNDNAVNSNENDGDNDTNETTEATAETIQWRMGHLSAEDHIWHLTSLRFAELVNEKTNGQIEIDIYPNNQLGGETDVLNSILAGNVDLLITGETMQNWAPKAALLAVPYAIRDADHLSAVVQGEIGREIEEEIIEKVGVTPLFYMERAPRNLTSNKPINSPDDLSGFRMRVPNVPLFLDAWEAAGATPQVMDFNEVFTGLQQGVIHGQENPVDLIHSAGFYEVQEYVNVTEHVYSWIYVVVGNEQFATLSDELQQAVLEAAEEAQTYGKELFEEEIQNYIDRLKAEGMTFNEDVDQNAFREAMEPAIEASLSEEQFELYQRIIEVE
ncbi:tripartite ATP-independent transporter DctP family solute receptor [Evansella vedderi]|uniref:Tripartite ATP-independent transporter DctP family solute receptor n=1 Tax=Evansella vedderi TaxID=38282 RepID=A0ABT9ZNX2_9BACI|nr:TRAP transporter substrate-binding protein [Evansella vedderi]MDQ0252922.1 tripartite ATP-independent transporter DctP family solute receptor [Evansella vedderi]